MARFHRHKAALSLICSGPDWKPGLERSIGVDIAASEAVSPLLALLPREESRWQAAYGLGLAVSAMAGEELEAARVVMRRLMWSMNEESGNLGWGIPEAMGCILAESPALAAEYGRILLSYGHDTGREDNFVEQPHMRRGVCWGIGRLALAAPDAAKEALPRLLEALGDADAGVRIMAAFAIRQLYEKFTQGECQAEDAGQRQAVRRALEEARETMGRGGSDSARIELFDGREIVSLSFAEALAFPIPKPFRVPLEKSGLD